jgi:hypothetical protein
MSQRNDPGTPSPSELDEAFTKVLGYLNFSNGKSDPDFLGQLNRIADDCEVETSWKPFQSVLSEQLEQLTGSSPAFSDVAQASAAISITFDSLLPAYMKFHSDLLFHLDPSDFVNPFFLGRCFEAVLEGRGTRSTESSPDRWNG